jgi:NADH:ubiquinone reductase (non-electrogenic)
MGRGASLVLAFALALVAAAQAFSSGGAGTGDRPSRVLVLGGGFGGVNAALKLAHMPWPKESATPKPEVVLVDREDKFVFLPLLYDIAGDRASMAEVAPSYREVLANSGINFVQGSVESLSLKDRKVVLSGTHCEDLDGYVFADDSDSTREVPFDTVIVALGASPAGRSAISGAEEHSMPFYTMEDAYRLRKELRRLSATTGPVRITVVGGSYVGVELASTIVESIGVRRARVTVVERSAAVLKAAAPANRRAGVSKLRSLGVNIMTGTAVQQVGPKDIQVGTGQGKSTSIPSDLVVWTAGSAPNALAGKLNVPLDDRGRVLVDDFLQIKGYEGVAYCIGDMAAVEGMTLPATAQVAMQQAECAAKNLAERDTGRLTRFAFTDLGEMLSLGGTDASLSAMGISVRGLAAAAARRAVYTVRMPTNRQRLGAAASLAAGGAFRLSAAAADMGWSALEKFANSSIHRK